MSHLIPQLRADKTGKLVTRHVRAEPKTTSGRTSIPSPVLPSSKKPAAAEVAVADQMEQRFSIGPFNWFGHDKVVTAVLEEHKRDESQTVELTSKEWLAARRVGLSDRRIHAFMLAGINDPEEMREYAQRYDKSLSPNIKPGVHRRREEWVDSLLAAGVTYEQFQAADKNFGSYSILTLLENFDFKGSHSDMVRMYAEYSNKQTRQALNEFLYDGDLTLDQLKEIGVSRVRKYKDVMLSYLVGDRKKISIDDFIEIVKHEEKNQSVLVVKTSTQITGRILAVEKWGKERAFELREPSSALHSSPAVYRAMDGMDDDESFAFAKHHDDILHMSILRESIKLTGNRNAQGGALEKTKDYSHLPDRHYYNPPAEETLEYFRAGLTPKETIEAMEQGISAISARGIKEGAMPAVAEGWL